MKIQMLGLCRFSLLSEGGFKIVHETLDDRRRLLYDPLRLEQRFLWFEHIALPDGRGRQTPISRWSSPWGRIFRSPGFSGCAM